MEHERTPEHSTRNEQSRRGTPTVSRVLRNGTIVELTYSPDTTHTGFVIWEHGTARVDDHYVVDTSATLVPYSANNNLIKHNVVLLPSGPEGYGTEKDLIHDIQAFLHRYVDLSLFFEKAACYYILLSWLYDSFRELPYLRLRGDYGTGKTRALLTIGSLCYKPIFASGASTISPLFHIIDAFRGTLIMDEGDFRFSDEKADMSKILNNGNILGFPVLRSEMTRTKEFSPRAFEVYGPKVVAMRGYYEDRALESRFLTEDMGQHTMRRDIPINLPDAHEEEALHIRNKLLLFRFRNLKNKRPLESLVDMTLEPRLNQVFVPLLSVVADEQTREELRSLARRYHNELAADRSLDTEAQLLEVIHDLASSDAAEKRSIKTITSSFIARFGQDYDRRISAKWIGWIIRKKLRLVTEKRHGVFVIPSSEQPKLDRLYERYGIVPTDVTSA